MRDFHNWAERYSERFVLMLCFSVIVLALSFGVQAWMRRRRNGSEVGANRRFRDSVVLLGVWGPVQKPFDGHYRLGPSGPIW